MFSFITTITKSKKRIVLLTVIAAVASAMAIGSGVFLGADNPIEEASEALVDYAIKETTGIDTDVDCSPQK